MSVASVVIANLFGDSQKIPIFDRLAYSLSDHFWKAIEAKATEYENQELQYTTLARISELSRQYEIYDDLCREIHTFLNLDLKDIPAFLNGRDVQDFDIKMLNEYLLSDDFLGNPDFNLRIEIDRIKQNHKQRFSMKKRDIVRQYYREFEEQRTTKQFKANLDTIKFPPLMLDRVEIMVHSPEYMTYKKDVMEVLKDSKFAHHIEVDRAQYTRHDLRESGYSDEEIEMYCPVNLDEQFSYIENRSILDYFKVDKKISLTAKPKKVRDGSGWSYIWRENGCVYRFNYEPPQGRAISLMVHANLQVKAWQLVVKDHPEFQAIYDKDFLREPNFVPIGYEQYYLEHEESAFREIQKKALDAYLRQMSLNGFNDVDRTKIKFQVLQAEVCWNNPLPTDPTTHLWLKCDQLSSIGLSPKYDAATPLMVQIFNSDVDSNQQRFAHKLYQKTKSILRSELIFKKYELSNEVHLSKLSEWRGNTLTISDYFLENLDLTKKYLYFKAHRRYQQISGLSDNDYYNWRNEDFIIPPEIIERHLTSVLYRHENDLPDWLLDVHTFNLMVDQDYFTRSHFKHFTEKQWRLRVRENELFHKKSHGQYRLIHPAVQEYRKVRDSLVSSKKPTLDELLQSSCNRCTI
ncbi:MAG TPA: hypothetical protein DCG34_08885 [Clostridiales bacterium]|nr:hypothetical protein [Clostridiales bacterium]